MADSENDIKRREWLIKEAFVGAESGTRYPAHVTSNLTYGEYEGGMIHVTELLPGDVVLSASEAVQLRDALRGSLGWFALFNDEPKSKWPAYVHRCEEALAILDVEGKGDGR